VRALQAELRSGNRKGRLRGDQPIAEYVMRLRLAFDKQTKADCDGYQEPQ